MQGAAGKPGRTIYRVRIADRGRRWSHESQGQREGRQHRLGHL